MVESCRSQPWTDISNIMSCVISFRIRTGIPQRLLNAAWRLIPALISPFQSPKAVGSAGDNLLSFLALQLDHWHQVLKVCMAKINISSKIAGVLGFSLLVRPFSRFGMGTENGFDPIPPGLSVTIQSLPCRYEYLFHRVGAKSEGKGCFVCSTHVSIEALVAVLPSRHAK